MQAVFLFRPSITTRRRVVYSARKLVADALPSYAWNSYSSSRLAPFSLTTTTRHYSTTNMHISRSSETYLKLAELPTYTSARFLSDNELSISASIADHDKNLKKSFSKTISLSESQSESQFEDSDEIKAIAISSTRGRKAILKQIDKPKPEDASKADSEEDKSGSNEAGDGKRRFVEIWKGDELEVSKEVTEDHGEFYPADFYRSVSFSPSEDAFVYTAEAREPESTEADPFAAYRYVPPLGEGFGSNKRAALFVFRWKKGEEATVDPVSLDKERDLPTLFGQAEFIDDTTLVATGYEQTPDGRLLGVKYCQNRPAGIFVLSTTEGGKYTATRITPVERSCRSPRVSPDRKSVYYLSNPVLGAHASCVSLHEYSLETKGSRTVVDTVYAPGDEEFPGLYMDQLPPQPFVSLPNDDRSYILTHSTWRSKNTLLLIDVKAGAVKDLTPSMSQNWVALTADGGNKVVAVRCSFTEPHHVVLGTIKSVSEVTWETVEAPDLPDSIKEKLASLEVSVIKVPGRGALETIVVKHKSQNKKLPSIMMVHGGPHGSLTVAINNAWVAYALDGYTLSMPNFSGSTGYGEDYLQALTGRCGSLDVTDCIETARHLVKIGISEEGPGKQFVMGGSHGGFLTGHLIGQYPDFFSAAVARNPVISAGQMGNTDIPDWYYSEFGVPYDHTSLVSTAAYDKMQSMSPIHYVDDVKTPLLLLIGLVDKRVCPTNGINYYHALKGRSKTVEMLAFPKDSHPLESVEAGRVAYESGRDWLIQYG